MALELDTEQEELAPEATDELTEQNSGVEDSTPPADDAAVDESSGGEKAIEQSGQLDEATASLAKFYGLDPATYGNDPEKIGQAVSHFDKKVIDFGRSLMSRQQTEQQTKETQTQEAFDLEKLLPPELSADEYDGPLVQAVKQSREAIKAVHDHYSKLLESQREQHEQRFGVLEQKHQAEQEKNYHRELDGFFEGLGGDWEGEFGKGAINKLPSHSPLVAARNAVVMDAMALEAGYAQYGIPAPAFGDLLKRALASRYSDKQTNFVRQQLVKEASGKRPPVSAGSSTKRGAPMSSRDRAAQTFREGLRVLQAGGGSLTTD